MKKLNKNMRILLPLILGIFLLVGYATVTNTEYQENAVNEIQPEEKEGVTFEHNYVNVKYRDDPVDIGHPRFDYLDTSKSSFIRGAWYDEDNGYMIIKLNITYYHYCGLLPDIWSDFKKAGSFGTYYNIYIKGNYDCRCNYVPKYKNSEA